jgi:hypothetical protein
MKATEVKLWICSPIVGFESLEPKSVDLVVTRLGSSNVRSATELLRVMTGRLKNDASVFLFVPTDADNPLFAHEVAVQWQSILKLENEFHWFRCDVPLDSELLNDDQHEYVFQLANSTASREQQLSERRRWAGDDVWFSQPETADIPPEIIARCVRLHGWRTNLVLVDTAVCSGESAIAAVEMGIDKLIGFCPDALSLTKSRERISRKLSDMEQARQQHDAPSE